MVINNKEKSYMVTLRDTIRRFIDMFQMFVYSLKLKGYYPATLINLKKQCLTLDTDSGEIISDFKDIASFYIQSNKAVRIA
jgi:hypothetical protein